MLKPLANGRRLPTGDVARSVRSARVLRFATAVITMLLGVLATGRAHAALLPACEVEKAATLMPEPSCEVVTTVDDATGETSVAPLCDPAGLSAIAPQRVLPVGDGRIEASGGCGASSGAPVVGPNPNDSNAPPGAAQHADVATAYDVRVALRAPCEAPEKAHPKDVGEPRNGWDRGVFHPPRAH